MAIIIAAAANEVWEVKTEGRIHGQQTLNVQHFKTPAGDSDVITHLLQVWLQCIVTSLLPGLSNQWTMDQVVGRRVAPTLGGDVFLEPTQLAVGGVTGDALPSFCSALFSIRTMTPGRSGRGRMFFPGLPEDAQRDSVIFANTATWAAILAFATCVVTNFIENEPVGQDKWTIGVLSRKLGNPKPPYNVNQFSGATNFLPRNAIATTRSRKVGHGS